MQSVGFGWLHHDTYEYMRPQQRSFVDSGRPAHVAHRARTKVPTWSVVCLVCTLFVKTKCLIALCLLGIQGVTSMTALA